MLKSLNIASTLTDMFSYSVLRSFLFFLLVINDNLITNATPFSQSELGSDKTFFITETGTLHEKVKRQAEDSSSTTTEKPESTTKPPQKSQKQQEPPKGPLELEPEAESVTPNNTTPKIPDLPDLPNFPPPPGLSPPGLSPPGLFPPSFYPGPFQPPRIPPPDFDPCSNPWSLEPLPEEGKKTKQDKLLAKMQCDFMMMQQKFSQLYKTVENELTELKKLNYNTVARLARLESLLRSAAPPPF